MYQLLTNIASTLAGSFLAKLTVAAVTVACVMAKLVNVATSLLNN